MAQAPDLRLIDVRRRLPTAVPAIAGVACLVAGAVLLLRGPQAGFDEVGALPVVAASPTAAPAGGTVPVELALPDRDVVAPVVAVGTDPAGGLVVPDSPSTVGWWAPSALVGGGAGPTVIAGHVDSAAAGVGALAVLRHVGLGEPVVVRGADGRAVRYAVAARREYLKADLPDEVFIARGSPGLVLITCGGRFDPVTRHYEQNVVVHAVAV